MLGLQIRMARVRSFISSSNFSTLGSENPSSMVVAIVRILAPGRDGKRHVIGISRFGHDNLVTRIEACHEREQHRFRTAGCNDYVIGCELGVVLIVIPHQLLAIAAVACTGTVLQYLTVNIADGVNRDLRRRQVGLSDIEVEYMDAPVCLADLPTGSQLSDRRAGISIPRIEIVGMSFFISFYHLSRKCSDLFDTKGKQRHKNFKNLIYIKNTMLFKNESCTFEIVNK